MNSFSFKPQRNLAADVSGPPQVGSHHSTPPP